MSISQIAPVSPSAGLCVGRDNRNRTGVRQFMAKRKWSEAQKRYAKSPGGKAARQKYQASEKGRAKRKEYLARRRAKLAETKQTKVITTNAPEVTKNKKEIKIKK